MTCITFNNYPSLSLLKWPQKLLSKFLNVIFHGKTIQRIALGGSIIYLNLHIITFINSKTNKKILLKLKDKFTDEEIKNIKEKLESTRKTKEEFQLINLVEENNEGANLLNLQLKQLTDAYDLSGPIKEKKSKTSDPLNPTVPVLGSAPGPVDSSIITTNPVPDSILAPVPGSVPSTS